MSREDNHRSSHPPYKRQKLTVEHLFDAINFGDAKLVAHSLEYPYVDPNQYSVCGVHKAHK